MSIWTLIGIAALLAVTVYLLVGGKKRSRQSVAQAPAKQPSALKTTTTQTKLAQAIEDKFRGVAVFAEADACHAVQRIAGKTFPENRTPHIPVDGCDRERCECRVASVAGRRRNPRRVHEDRRTDIRFGEERRSHHDRREGQETWDLPVD